MGGGDDAHVHADQFAPAYAEELALGQHPQQPRLQRQRHVADFVQKQRAAIGLLEATDVALLRAGEGAGFVAEQFALQQLRRNRSGVQRDERLARTRRLVVQRMRDQFLAGAGLAGDQHRQRRLRQAADRAEQRAHRRRVADQLGRGRGIAVLCGLGGFFRIRQGARGQRHGIVQVERLGQEFMRAAAERTGGAGDVGVRRHHDHRQLRVRGLQLVQQHQAVVAGHAHIGEQQVGRTTRTQGLQGGGGAVETVHRVARIAQGGGQHEAYRTVVVDHPDAACVGGAAGSGQAISGHDVPRRGRATTAAAAG